MMDAIVEATHIQNVLIYNKIKVRAIFSYRSKGFSLLQGLKIPSMTAASQNFWQEPATARCLNASPIFRAEMSLSNNH
jgi:hypothetical protein